MTVTVGAIKKLTIKQMRKQKNVTIEAGKRTVFHDSFVLFDVDDVFWRNEVGEAK